MENDGYLDGETLDIETLTMKLQKGAKHADQVQMPRPPEHKSSPRTLKSREKGNFGDYLAKIKNIQSEAKDLMLGMLTMKPSNDVWRHAAITPPGTSMERILAAFKTETDIPLELPFFTMMHFISGYLLSKNVHLDFMGDTMRPELWTIVLADSGSGKSYAHKVLSKEAPVKSDFPAVVSAAKFVEELAAHNNGLWFQDEFAQMLKQIETTGGPLSEVKGYLLDMYGNGKVERSSKTSGTITVEPACLGILGLNTQNSFFNAMSAESLADGFAQRFSYVIAEKDPLRQMKHFPTYNMTNLRDAARKAFDQVLAVKLHETYMVGEFAVESFRQAFTLLADDANIPPSFYRRIMFKAVKYALFYHIILGKETAELDGADIGWGARLAVLHMYDTFKLLAHKKGFGEVLPYMEKALHVKEMIEARGETFSYRNLQQGIKGVEKAEQAKKLFELISM